MLGGTIPRWAGWDGLQYIRYTHGHAKLDSSFTRISGAGEHIVRTGLARTIADVLRPKQDGTTEVDVHDLLMRTLSARFHGEFGRINLCGVI